MSSLDLSKFKKVGANKTHTVFQHPEGHVIHVAHKAVKHEDKGALKGLPVQNMAQGGMVKDPFKAFGEIAQPTKPLPPMDPAKLKAFKAFADGGEVIPDGTEQPLEQPPMQQELPIPQQWMQPQAAPQAAPMAMPEQVNPIGANNGLPEGDRQPASQPQGADFNQIPGYAQADNAINLGKSIQEKQMGAETSARQKHLAAVDEVARVENDHRKELLTNIAQVTKEIGDGTINPNQYVENMSVLGKVGTAVGMVLAGYGTKGIGENPALTFLNQQINRDVDAQKAGLGQRKTLLEAYQKQFGDSLVAENMTKATLAARLGDQLALAATKDGSLKAKQNALAAQSQLMQQYYPLVVEASKRRAALSQAGENPGKAVEALVPKELQKAAMEEVGIMSNKQQAKAQIGDLLRKAQEANKIGNGGSIPGTSNYKTLQQTEAQIRSLLQANWKGPMTDVEAEKLVNPYLSSVTDDDKDVQRKAQGLVDMLARNGKPTPILDTYKINKKDQAPEELKTVNGVTYRRGPNGEAIRVK